MATPRNLGIKLLAIWLIVGGLIQFMGAMPPLGFLMGLLGIAAGVLILMGR